jgi:hypothetical protein
VFFSPVKIGFHILLFHVYYILYGYYTHDIQVYDFIRFIENIFWKIKFIFCNKDLMKWFDYFRTLHGYNTEAYIAIYRYVYTIYAISRSIDIMKSISS